MIGVFMKKILITFLPLLFIFVSGCSNDSGGGSNPFGTGGTTGGTGNVTIQVQGQADGQGNYIFYINPSVAINLTSVTASVPAQQYEETIDINEQFQAGTLQGCIQYDANVIQSGMQFTFRFVGTITNGGQNFDVTTNYTIP
jgi:hypothetical protein